ncbi:hypothetical protein [Burkholderia ambifaria]|uniref:hypothetical protein n=1 Tax=Burkholderia ambifaria TaxID=152480 RepID=UPI00158D37D7|nr:hypothetical protein [Burkholderia ambifaria]
MKLPNAASSTLALAAGLLLSVSAFGAIDLIPKEVVVHDKAAAVQIINNGKRPEYVSISLSRLLNPGVPFADEKLEPVGDAEKPALFASPFRLTLAPGQTKTITLEPLHAVESETVYRLDVKPVLKILPGEQQKTSGTVVVNLSFSGLVRQLPAKENASLSVSCNASGAQLTATGSVRYTVKDAKVDGRALDNFNVYPGVPLPLTGRNIEIPGQPACHGTGNSLGKDAAAVR